MQKHYASKNHYRWHVCLLLWNLFRLFFLSRISLSLSTDSCVNYFLYQLFSLTTIFFVNYFLCQRFPLSTIFSMNFSFIHCQHRKSLTNNFYKSLILTIIWTFYKYLFLRQNFSLVSLRNLSTKSLYHYFIRREGMAKDFLEKSCTRIIQRDGRGQYRGHKSSWWLLQWKNYK